MASSIAGGEAWPLQGPILAGAIHAGPVWYYLFALPFLVATTVLPALLFIGALAALKIPLAYLIGARFVDRPTGLLWALLLVLPGWGTFEGVLPLHPSLVATCTLGFVWLVLLYARDGRPLHLCAAGFVFALALHAHPSTFGLAFLLLATMVYRHRSASRPWPTYAMLAAAICVPFVPYVLFQVDAGFPDLSGAANYLSEQRNLGSIEYLPGVLVGVFATGPATVVDNFAAGIGKAPSIVIGVYGFIYAAAIFGLMVSMVTGKRRAAIVAMTAAFIVLLRRSLRSVWKRLFT